ncbi:MAG: hypothetical protein AB1633_09670, partial [Elusimicrobiota bacterium]
MKKAMALAILGAILCSGTSMAQEEERNSLITIAPVGLIYSALYANFDTKIGEKMAIEPRIGYFNFKSGDIWDMTYLNVGLTLNFLGKKGLKGFVWGPRFDVYSVSAKYTYTTITYSDPTYTYSTATENISSTQFGVGVQAVYRWISKGGFVTEIGAVASGVLGGKVETSSGVSAPTPSAVGFSPIFN